MICIVYFLRQEETFFHTDAKICYSFNLLAVTLFSFDMFGTIDNKLREPKWIHKLLSVFDNIIENKV